MAFESLSENFAVLRERIDRAGGDQSVRILPVTKGFGPDAIAAAIATGCTSIGENYAQELLAKQSIARAVEVHFIGQLQTNKVRQLTGLVQVYETVDRSRLAREIARRAPGATVMVQIDINNEPGKGGCTFVELDELADEVVSLGLDLRGLMTVGPTTGGPEAARDGFRRVRREVERRGLEICSMGMSADIEVAVQEGSTQVRVGTALFGERHVPLAPDQVR